MMTLTELQYEASLRNKESLFIILDGSCEPQAMRYLFSFDGVVEYSFLYLGTRFSNIMEYGPILAKVDPQSTFLSWFWNEGSHLHAGIAFFSSLSFKKLSSQLKTILTVTLPDNNQALFRFYDPRLVKTALIITAQNGCTALTSQISCIYAPEYRFGSDPLWKAFFTTGGEHLKI